MLIPAQLNLPKNEPFHLNFKFLLPNLEPGQLDQIPACFVHVSPASPVLLTPIGKLKADSDKRKTLISLSEKSINSSKISPFEITLADASSEKSDSAASGVLPNSNHVANFQHFNRKLKKSDTAIICSCKISKLNVAIGLLFPLSANRSFFIGFILFENRKEQLNLIADHKFLLPLEQQLQVEEKKQILQKKFEKLIEYFKFVGCKFSEVTVNGSNFQASYADIENFYHKHAQNVQTLDLNFLVNFFMIQVVVYHKNTSQMVTLLKFYQKILPEKQILEFLSKIDKIYRKLNKYPEKITEWQLENWGFGGLMSFSEKNPKIRPKFQNFSQKSQNPNPSLQSFHHSVKTHHR